MYAKLGTPHLEPKLRKADSGRKPGRPAYRRASSRVQDRAASVLVLLRCSRQEMRGERCLMERFVHRLRDHARDETENENGNGKAVNDFFRE